MLGSAVQAPAEGIESPRRNRAGDHCIQCRPIQQIDELIERFEALAIDLDAWILSGAIAGGTLQCPFYPDDHKG
jgi:hypothetical protein